MQINTNNGSMQDNCTIDNLPAGMVEWGPSNIIFHINICLTIFDEVSGYLQITIPRLESTITILQLQG